MDRVGIGEAQNLCHLSGIEQVVNVDSPSHGHQATSVSIPECGRYNRNHGLHP